MQIFWKPIFTFINLVDVQSVKNRLILTIGIALFVIEAPLFSLNISIVESRSIQPTSIMDLKWQAVAVSKGHTATIYDQSILDNELFFNTTDLLIISSGEIDLPQNRINTILNFIRSGKSVYLQTEHDSIFTTNKAFSFIVRTLGSKFMWKHKYSGNLKNIKVINSFSDTEDVVNDLSYYWYSISGEGDCRLYPFLQYQNENHGFQYIPGDSSLGSISTTTDEDWVRDGVSTRLMANIIYHLIHQPQPILDTSQIDLGPDTFICNLDTIDLSIPGNASIGMWQDGAISNSYLVNEPGIYWVTVESDCENRYGEIIIEALSDIGLATQTIDTSFCSGSEIFIDVSTINGTYHWMDGDTVGSKWLSYAGRYFVEIGNGCYLDTLNINLNQEDCACSFTVPNVFSPNNDGVNDSLSPDSYCLALDFSFSIFDRWGNMIYNTTNQHDVWNGKLNENDLPPGVYVYLLKYSFKHNVELKKVGDISLLR